MSSTQSLYITSQISVIELSEKDLLREFEIMKLRHDMWTEKSFSDFESFLKGWREDKYSFAVEDVAYYLSEQDAVFAVESNLGDLYECGSYNYASVIRLPIACLYARYRTTRDDIKIFHYDAANDEYLRIYEYSNEYEENISFYNLMKDAVRNIEMGSE